MSEEAQPVDHLQSVSPALEAVEATAKPPVQKALPHIAALDGLRGLAIGLVLYVHAFHLLQPVTLGDQGWPWLLQRLSRSGWLGVDLFFVVSGYLITTILLRVRESGLSMRGFWMRRALRIMPLFYLYLLVVFGGVALIRGVAGQPNFAKGIDFGLIPYYVAYLANLATALRGWPDNVLVALWSLAIEEQFYLVWPILMLLLRPKTMVKVCLILAVASPIFRFAVFHRYSNAAAYVLTPCRVDGIALGALAAILLSMPQYHHRLVAWSYRLRWPAVLSFAIVYGLASVNEPVWLALGVSVANVAFAIATTVAVHSVGAWRRILCSRPLLWLGQRCYGLYMWHLLVGVLLRNAIAPEQVAARPLLWMFGWLLATAAVAEASWRYFEAPILRFKRYFP